MENKEQDKISEDFNKFKTNVMDKLSGNSSLLCIINNSESNMSDLAIRGKGRDIVETLVAACLKYEVVFDIITHTLLAIKHLEKVGLFEPEWRNKTEE